MLVLIIAIIVNKIIAVVVVIVGRQGSVAKDKGNSEHYEQNTDWPLVRGIDGFVCINGLFWPALLRLLYRLGLPPDAAVLPHDFDHEDQERHDDAEEEPPVDELHGARLGQGLADSLVHRVHNQHDGQGQTYSHLIKK